MNNERLVAIIAIIAALAAIIIAADADLRVIEDKSGHSHPFTVADQDDVDWLLDRATANVNNDVVFQMRTKANAGNITQIWETLELHQAEIIKNRKALDNAQIGVGDADKDKLDEQESTTFGLTVKLESSEYYRGDIVWVRGTTAEPHAPVEGIILLPKDDPLSLTEAPKYRYLYVDSDRNGAYVMGLVTNFDDNLGLYEVHTKSGGKLSEKLTFELKK